MKSFVGTLTDLCLSDCDDVFVILMDKIDVLGLSDWLDSQIEKSKLMIDLKADETSPIIYLDYDTYYGDDGRTIKIKPILKKDINNSIVDDSIVWYFINL